MVCPVIQTIILLIHEGESGIGVAANGSHDQFEGGTIPNKSFILQDASVKSAKKAGKEDAGRLVDQIRTTGTSGDDDSMSQTSTGPQSLSSK